MAHHTPAIADDGAANGYTAVNAKFRAMQRAAAGLLEQAEVLAQQMRANARAATTVADLCATAHVDPRHVSAVAEVGGHFARVAGGCARLMGAADSVHAAAGHLRAEHQAEYGGVHAAVNASRARQAKPGFYLT